MLLRGPGLVSMELIFQITLCIEDFINPLIKVVVSARADGL